MKIIHTSDWHLGDRLLEKSRYEEFRAFLNWLLEQMQKHGSEALLVSGDLFDTRDPGAPALELFNDFLSRADSTGCRHVILTAGNHDGVPVLEAASPLLQRYHAVMVNRLNRETAADCLLPLCGDSGEEELLVCAVPFLRPSEVSRPLTEESLDAGENAYTLGVRDVLSSVAEHAAQWRAEHPRKPILCMAHLTVCGAQKTSSVQDIVVGSIDAVGMDAFPEVFDYVALGHIHKGYSPDGARLHYSGSPMPMGMDETDYQHHILLLDATEQGVSVQKIPVPLFVCHRKEICRTEEELAALPHKLQELSAHHGGVPVHLELHYHGAGVDNLATWAAEHLPEELVPHFKVSMWREGCHVLDNTELYGDMMPTPEEVFERKLTAYCEAGEELSEEQMQSLRALFASAYTEARSHEDSKT
ncbi:MAG: exonuclease subunit SbcD [Akkermansia sp.]|nr:exonuclease subunit SbcD [Akkermansia sp.]